MVHILGKVLLDMFQVYCLKFLLVTVKCVADM